MNLTAREPFGCTVMHRSEVWTRSKLAQDRFSNAKPDECCSSLHVGRAQLAS